MFLFKLAFLNITRNRRRSLITVLAVGVGLAALIFLWAFMDGSQDQQRENAIRLATGHVQIHAADFRRKLSPEMTLPNRADLVSKIKSHPSFLSLVEHVTCEALIGTSENSRGIMLYGIDPKLESNVLDIEKHVREGSFLSGQNREVLIGWKLAEKLDAGLGDKVVIMTQAMDGTLAGFAYRVKGIIRSGATALDEMSASITLEAAQELLGIESEIHEIAIRLKKRSDIPHFIKDMQAALPAEDYQVSSWDEIIPEINQWASYSDAIIRTMLIAVMAVIGVGVMNTILMSILERTRELGVMMAIGTSPSRIISLIFLETFILQSIGIFCGIVLGYLLTFYFSKVGIQLSGFEDAFAQSFTSSIIYPQIQVSRVWECVRSLVLITSFISLYPAWRVGTLEPVKAIYHS